MRARGGEQPQPWSASHPVIGRDDHRSFGGSDDWEPLRRLARFIPDSPVSVVPDPHGLGGRYVEVVRGGLADVPRVYVFTHGWLPGGRASARRSLAVAGRDPWAWDVDVTNQYGKAPVRMYTPLLAAIAERDPEAAVLWFSWVDQSATDTSLFAARESLRHAPINGRRLAAALSHAIWDRSDVSQSRAPRIHLIGHSHGCVVSVNAALSAPLAPDQLTLLDCPEDWFSHTGGAAGLLTGTLPRLHPGRTPGTTFVDAYATMFGRAYHDRPGLGQVVDVRVTPPALDPKAVEPRASQAHQFAVAWYADTVRDVQARTGFAWAVVRGWDPSDLSPAYLATRGGLLKPLPSRKTAPDGAHEHMVSDLRVPTQQLTNDAPDLSVLLDLPGDAEFVEFDVSFAQCDPDARVDVAFGGNLSFTSYAAAPVPTSGRFIRVRPGHASIQFRLQNGGVDGTVTVSRIRVVRNPAAVRNADDRGAVLRAGLLGAVAGSAATVAALTLGWAAMRGVRRLLS